MQILGYIVAAIALVSTTIEAAPQFGGRGFMGPGPMRGGFGGPGRGFGPVRGPAFGRGPAVSKTVITKTVVHG
uniref:Uncharacterized protein n=1 Tax=Strongyloides stercoralis TaxID=6248 RepID=A0A0K0ERR2_STRER